MGKSSISSAWMTGLILNSVLVLGVLASPLPEEANVLLLADRCALCHGINGMGSERIAPLKNELKVSDFISSMNAYASGEERSTVMAAIVQGLTEQEIKLLANHFGKPDEPGN